MVTYLVTHQSTHGPAHPTLQGDRAILESAETEDRNQIVWRPVWCLVDSLIKRSFSTSTLLLGLLAILCGLGWFLSRHHGLLGESLPPPIVRLDHATFVGKSQGQTETFQGIPYARPPWVSFAPIVCWILRAHSIGKLRLRKPEPLPPYTGKVLATQPGFSCPQMPPRLVPPDGLSDGAIGYIKIIKAAYPDSEDCKCSLLPSPWEPF